MLAQILLGLAAILWGGLLGYSTLLVMLVFMLDTESMYAYSMRMALDRFVETLGCGWLKPLHELAPARLRWISYGLFGSVSLGVTLMLVFLDS